METIVETEKGLKQAYFHINNGGILFEVDSELSSSVGLHPVLRVSASHFGHRTNQMEIIMTPSQMRKLGEWLVEESRNAEQFTDKSAKDSKEYPFLELMFQPTNGGPAEFHEPRSLSAREGACDCSSAQDDTAQ